MFNCAKIQTEIAGKFRENLLFCATADLQKTARCSAFRTEFRARCCAVLFERAFFSADEEQRKFLDELLPDDEFEQFCAGMPRGYFKPEIMKKKLWQPDNTFSAACLAAVRAHFQKLFAAEGIIPVFNDDEGFLIPFELKEDGSFRAEDWQGTEIPEWSGYLKQLDIPARLRLHCSQTNEVKFAGNSMMLPTLCAWWRKQGKLPQYSPFRIVFSGAFDSSQKLIPVGLEKKQQVLAERFREYTFVVPESDGQKLKPSSQLKILPALTAEKLLSRIQEITETVNATTMEYALARLPQLARDVLFFRTEGWDEALVRLQNTASFHKETNPQEYLLNLMLQSECCCHGGFTAKAAEINRQAQKFAIQYGNRFEHQLWRLQIERLVILTDGEDFEQIQSSIADFEKRLTELDDADLLMRFHGTMGQIAAYGTLSKLPGFSATQSLTHFEKAKEFALSTKNLAEIRHDMNYIHLWHALFEPGSAEEEESFKNAGDWIEQDSSDENYDSNKLYLYRQKYFALYRALLKTGNIPAMPENLFKPKKANWQSCCIRKYAGALEAAQGRTGKAEKYFQEALELLNTYGESVLNFIKMTIYAEYFRSLGKEEARQQALSLLDELKNVYPHSVPKWRDFLNKKAPFPGLSYWY